MGKDNIKEIERAYKEVAKESRELDKRELKYECMGPEIHGIRRMRLIPPYAMNASRHIYAKVICPHNRKIKGY